MSHANYSLTYRAAIPARVGMLGQVMAAIGDVEGQVGGVDIVRASKDAVTRDITVYARDEAHGSLQHQKSGFGPAESARVANAGERTRAEAGEVHG